MTQMPPDGGAPSPPQEPSPPQQQPVPPQPQPVPAQPQPAPAQPQPAPAQPQPSLSPAQQLAAKGWKCGTCGGWLAWNPTKVALVCRSCSASVGVPEAGPVVYHDFSADAVPTSSPGQDIQFTCPSCGADTGVPAAELSGSCKYCSAPWVATAQHGPSPPPDGVVPASIDIDAARADVAKWVKSRWFAPNKFKSGAAQPTITLAYHPVWVFDSGTTTEYSGERGDDYTTTETRTNANGQTETYTVTHTRWSPASGTVRHDFTDVAAPGGADTNPKSEWEYSASRGYSDAYLVGTRAYAATIPLNAAWQVATQTMEGVIRGDIDRDIGGDHQRIDSMQTEYDSTKGRYLLAPSWSGTYMYGTKQYTVDINAETGKVTGTRPYSAIKIALAVIALLIIVAAVIAFFVLSRKNSTNTTTTDLTGFIDTNPLLAGWWWGLLAGL